MVYHNEKNSIYCLLVLVLHPNIRHTNNIYENSAEQGLSICFSKCLIH